MKLTPREHTILTLMACGWSDKEIASNLDISRRTVEAHAASLVVKLKAKNRIQAAVIYLKHNPKWKIGAKYVL